MTSPLPQPPSASGRTNRRSYFQEGPMEEHTPTHYLPEQRRQSLPSSSSPQPQPQSQPQTQQTQTRPRPLASFAASLSRRGGEELLHVGFWVDGRGRPALRVLNAAAHLVVCSVLLAIVVQFLVRYRGKKSKYVWGAKPPIPPPLFFWGGGSFFSFFSSIFLLTPSC